MVGLRRGRGMTSSAVPPAILGRIRSEMLAGYERLLAVAEAPAFQSLLDDLYRLPAAARPGFVAQVVIDPEERRARRVEVPDDVLVVRSSFGDRRPTLFCLKRYLPADLHRYWQNVNITFDNAVDAERIPSDERAWRKPLPAEIQAALITAGDGAG
jgi:hypothetical protein